MKSHIMDEICIMLLRKGYVVKGLKSSCFDILARKESSILLLKVLEDANSITKEYADEMNSVAAYINSTPLVIAEKAGQKLEDNVVYLRHGICTINPTTLSNCADNKFPFIKKTNAGLTAHIIGNRMRGKREEEGLSLNAMAKKLGVSGKMVSRYEQGQSEVTIANAIKIYNTFGSSVFHKISMLERKENPTAEPKSDVSKKYVEIGFAAMDTKKSPFDIIAKKSKTIVITELGDKTNPDSMAISKLVGANNLVIFTKKKPKDIAAITKKEFLEFEESEELIKFLREF